MVSVGGRSKKSFLCIGRLSFDEFCVLMVSVGGERRKIDSSGAGVDMLIENGLTIADMKRSGIGLHLLRGHYGPKRLAVEGNYTALEFRLAGIKKFN